MSRQNPQQFSIVEIHTPVSKPLINRYQNKHMQLFNVLSKQEFIKDGETKKLWHKVGIIKITQSGKMYLQLFQFPNVTFYVVEPKKHQDSEEILINN